MEIKIFKIKKNFKKRNFQPNTDFYWKMILLFVFLMILVSFAFGIYLFLQINTDFVSSNIENTSAIKTIKKERIDKVLQYFTDKQNKSTDIINSPSPIVDPSL